MIKSAGIVGLGLIGGSLARDLRERGVRVYALDTDARTVSSARDEGIVVDELDPSLGMAAELDVIVLAVPLAAATGIMERTIAALQTAPLIIDTCSTKQTILDLAGRLGLGTRFVGTHPLAGDHCSGWDASRPGLFRGAITYVCPHPDAAPGCAERARLLWEGVGAVPTFIPAGSHDRLLAWTSHLPQVVSTAVARVLAGEGIGREQLGPGARDVTRLAASPADMWTGIALDNAPALHDAILHMEIELSELRRVLNTGDAAGVHAFFAKTGVGNELRGVAPHGS